MAVQTVEVAPVRKIPNYDYRHPGWLWCHETKFCHSPNSVQHAFGPDRITNQLLGNFFRNGHLAEETMDKRLHQMRSQPAAGALPAIVPGIVLEGGQQFLLLTFFALDDQTISDEFSKRF
jgi:hypothetical protein